MQNFTVSKDAQIVDVIGFVHAELAPNTALQNGDDLASGEVLSLAPGSELTLRFDDGSEQLLTGMSDETLANNTQTTQQTPVSLIAQTQDQTATAATPDSVQDDINAIQASIESGDDIELPDTAAGGLTGNEGTDFINLNRDGKELLAGAGFDTTELDNAIGSADVTNIDAVNPADVNIAPVAQDDSFSLSQNAAVSGNVITHNDGDGEVDTDTDDDTLSVTQVVVNGITTSVAAVGTTAVAIEGGTLSISANGDFTYTNSEGFDFDPADPATQPSFTYTLSDGVASDTANVSITINDSAPVANDDTQSIVLRGDIVNGAASETVSGNIITAATAGDVTDTSADGTVTLVSVAGERFVDSVTPIVITTSFGQLSIVSSGAYSYTSTDGVALPANAVTESFAYVIEDGDARQIESDTATLRINLTPEPVNIAPVAQDDSFSLSQGAAVSGNVITHNDNNDGVVDSDADGDDGDLKITHVESFAISGDAIFKIIDGVLSETTAAEILLDSTFIGTSDNGILSINTSGVFTYENKGFLEGSSAPSFEYTLSDGADTDTARVTIDVETNAPNAVADINFITLTEAYGSGTAFANIIGGNVVNDRSTGDVTDTSNIDGFGTPVITQVVYEGAIYLFTNTITLHVITTDYGVLTINNTGEYEFTTPRGLALPNANINVEFEYTIQDGDLLNPETDSEILTIQIMLPVAPNSQSNDLDIELSQTNGTIDTDFDPKALINVDEADFVFGQNTDDLSDILTDGGTGGLEKYLAVMGEDEGAMVNIDLVAVFKNTQTEESIVLEKNEADSEHTSFSTVTNGLLADGAIIVSDVATETIAPIAELDSQDFL